MNKKMEEKEEQEGKKGFQFFSFVPLLILDGIDSAVPALFFILLDYFFFVSLFLDFSTRSACYFAAESSVGIL